MKTCQDCGTNCVERGKKIIDNCPNFTRKGSYPLPIHVDVVEPCPTCFTLFNGASVCSLCLLNDNCSEVSDHRTIHCKRKIPVKAKVAESATPCDYCVYNCVDGKWICKSCRMFTEFCGVKAFIL